MGIHEDSTVAASAALADEWDRGSDFDDCASAAGDLFPVDDESDIVQYIPGDVVS